MAVLRVHDGVIVMQTLLWPDEIRKPDFATLEDGGKATKQELAMADLLIEQLAGDYEPDEYEDDYAAAVQALVKAKVEGGEVQHAPESKDESGEVVDLLAALKKSVDKAKASRGEAPSDSAPAKSSGKSTAKKTAAKKTTTKKTAKKAAKKAS
jgi:DNA end-binding protein Ku